METIATEMGLPLHELISNQAMIQKIEIKRYINATVGALTLQDIVTELQKPGRDPRVTFERPQFRDDVMEIKDLKVGMKLEGIVTNVTAFGAFVDIGVHQDGLIHVSELSDRFIRDPSEVVRAGDKIKVEVLSIDVDRKRIALTAKQNRGPTAPKSKDHSQSKREKFNANPFANLGS